MSKKTQATLVLVIMFLGFIATYKLDSFLGLLLNHGFLAALIGGLADWFAVTALFRKPLGFISYRTEILPRNRERIMDEIVKFIGRDLLNPEYIINNIKNYNMAMMVVEYAQKGGKEKAKVALKELVMQVINSLDTKKVGYSLASALKSRRKNFNIARIIIQFLLDFIKTPAGDKCIDYIIKMVRATVPELLAKDFMHKLIDDNVSIIKEKYIKDSQKRSFMFEMMDLSSENLTQKLNKKLDEYTNLLLDYDSKEREHLKTLLAEKIEILGSRNGYKQKVAQLEHYFFVKKFDFSDNLVSLIDNFCQNSENREQLWKQIEDYLDNLMAKLAVDDEMQAKLNKFFINTITKIIQNNSQWGLDYIKDELMKYSQQEFVDLVEKRVGDDLQMIRINGSVVGAIAGMGLYVISFVVERMCG